MWWSKKEMSTKEQEVYPDQPCEEKLGLPDDTDRRNSEVAVTTKKQETAKEQEEELPPTELPPELPFATKSSHPEAAERVRTRVQGSTEGKKTEEHSNECSPTQNTCPSVEKPTHCEGAPLAVQSVAGHASVSEELVVDSRGGFGRIRPSLALSHFLGEGETIQSQPGPIESALSTPGDIWVYPSSIHSDDTLTQFSGEHDDLERLEEENASLTPSQTLSGILWFERTNSRLITDTRPLFVSIGVGVFILLTTIATVVAVLVIPRSQQSLTATSQLFGQAWDPSTTTRITLSRKNLAGTLPSEIGLMTKLTYLDLADNLLYGSIPSSLISLTQLEHLDLHSNLLDGGIPSMLGMMTRLTWLDFSYNSLGDSLPSALGLLEQLRFLGLGYNSFDNSIPSTFGLLTQLTCLNLMSNSLHGSIPTTLESLTHLLHLHLGANALNGSIPSTVGSLTQLTFLSLSRNFLLGSVPNEIGSLTQLERLFLNSNSLSGPVPTDSLSNLVDLNMLWLYDNAFSGSIASSLCSVVSPLIDCGEIVCDCCGCA